MMTIITKIKIMIINKIRHIIQYDECNTSCKHYGKFASELEYGCNSVCRACRRNYSDKYEVEKTGW